MNYHTLMAASASIRMFTGVDRYDAAVVLGSGLGSYATAFNDGVEIKFVDIPGFPIPKVAGHSGSVVAAPLGNKNVLLFSGRVHAYEGWEMDEIVFGVRTAVACGAKRIMLTNAAGGINPAYAPGDLVMISDHLNLTGRNPLVGANDDRLGPRFPDMSEVYSADLRAQLADTFRESGLVPHEGVYAAFLGPTYETPAEVQMAKTLGADLVGMSTVPEAIAIRHMGAEVVGVSLVTNLAAGISPTPLSHDEVTETAARARATFTNVLDRFLPTLIDSPID
ncbi:MAG: purine-nucleoside phosphorylase [Armatimonadetes bacterium]|nr:MAG: purine-nucleoside phosphorylase [Armatimonadota bacterium]